MKKLLLISLIVIAFTQCKKEKYCHVCTTTSERTYTDGREVLDTFNGQLCNDEDFIKAYIKNGTFNGPTFEIEEGDTIRFDLIQSTICTRK